MNINLINQKKKLDLTKFFGENAWITIKRINKDIRDKIKIISSNPVMFKMAQIDMNKKIVNFKGLDNLKIEEMQEATRIAQQIQELYLEYGVDKTEHNFTDNNKPIELNKEFWNIMSDEVIEYIVNEIKEFNEVPFFEVKQ